VLQKLAEERKGKEVPLFLLGLGRHSNQVGDEGDLPGDVSFAHISDLSLANHVHDLIALQRSPCCLKGEETHPRLDQAFDKTVVLLHQMIEVFDQALVRHAREAFQRL
jgi:hypothetical protein